MANTHSLPSSQMLSNSDASIANRMLDVATDRLSLLQAIFQLTLQQTEYVQTNEIEQLVSLVNKKTDAIQGLRNIHQAARSIEPNLTQIPSWPSSEIRQQVLKAWLEGDKILQSLMQIDQHSLDHLSKQKDLLSHQMAHFASLESIHQAYEPNAIDSEFDENDTVTSGFSAEG
jgi:hypothetical protein